MSGSGAGYDLSTITYSPEGKVFQVEYAEKAVDGSGTSLGVRCKDGLVLGVEKMIANKMLVKGSNRRVHMVDHHIGVTVAGLAGDGRQLVNRAREECSSYRNQWGESIPPRVLAENMAAVLHIYTCYWYLRPFGASIIIAGYDPESKQHELYMATTNGEVHRYHGCALGKGARSAKSEIEKYKFAERNVDDALGYVAKIMHTVHDKTKDKPFELELLVISEATGWKAQRVSDDKIKSANEWAIAQIDAEEEDEDDDEDDDIQM